MPAVKNIHHGIDIRYAKSSNHLFIKYQETAKAGIAAKATSFRKSFESNATIVDVSAPKTFLMPISLSLCMIAKAERPNKPKQAMKMASEAKMISNVF